jgi:hypothetical protein
MCLVRQVCCLLQGDRTFTRDTTATTSIFESHKRDRLSNAGALGPPQKLLPVVRAQRKSRKRTLGINHAGSNYIAKRPLAALLERLTRPDYRSMDIYSPKIKNMIF